MKPSAAYIISLTVIAALVGLGILPIFARYSNKVRLAIAKRKISAALAAFRLFGDEPRLVFRAQGQLLLWNARYLGLVFKPALIVMVPVGLLLLQMDVLYGSRPLHIGETTLVTARMADTVNLSSTLPVLTGNGIAVESPAVRIPQDHQVVWNVRATTDGRDSLSLQTPGSGITEKSIRVGNGMHYLSPRRVSSLLDWLHYPAERRLTPDSPVRSIDIQYPEPTFTVFGIDMPWILWFVIVSWTVMFALRKRFGVII